MKHLSPALTDDNAGVETLRLVITVVGFPVLLLVLAAFLGPKVWWGVIVWLAVAGYGIVNIKPPRYRTVEEA